MKVLLSVFACAPNTGSEAGGGWHYALKLAEQHQVWAITDISRKVLIDQYQSPLPPNLTIVYFRPSWLHRVALNSRTAHFIYQAWQNSVHVIAKQLDDEHDFDCCWHLTYGVFRQPSSLWKIGKPFIFGPVGGGESAPLRLLQGLPFRERLKELVRNATNYVALYNPALRRMYQNAALVIARTADTKSLLPAKVQKKTFIQQEIGGYPKSGLIAKDYLDLKTRGLNILFVGRLLGWKGTHIAVLAFAVFLKAGGNGKLTIVGNGPMRSYLNQLVLQYSLAGRVIFIEHVKQDQLFLMYPQYDVFLFPSLHDSGGNVVLEALSFGLPVICLDLGGPKSFVNSDCGWIVETQFKSVNDLSTAISLVLLDALAQPVLLAQKSQCALDRVLEVTWAKQFERIIDQVENVLRQD